MINQIKEFLNRFVTLPDDNVATLLALYVVHSWSWQLNDCTPYLYIWSPLKQSGKTRLLEVLELLVHNPIRAASVTPSALYRVIEERKPTMLIDEVDTVFYGRGSRHADLIGVINSGYKRGGSSIRTKGNEVVDFSTFCPKILAGINNQMIPDTVADRSISIELQRKAHDETLEPFYYFQAKNEADSLLEDISEWVFEHEDQIRNSKPNSIQGISDRKWEIGAPLATIGSLVKYPKYKAILSDMLSREIPRETRNPVEQLMKDICELFDGNEKMFSSDVAEYLEFSSPKMLANQLGIFGIEPKRIRIGNRTGRGYHKKDMEPILKRNL